MLNLTFMEISEDILGINEHVIDWTYMLINKALPLLQ